MCDMSEERFELTINSNGQADIIDKVESKEKNAICIYNDLGVPPYSSAKAVCDLLNGQEKRINKLKEIIIKITHSYHQKHDNTIVNLVDEVYEENIGDLFIEWNHGE